MRRVFAPLILCLVIANGPSGCGWGDADQSENTRGRGLLRRGEPKAAPAPARAPATSTNPFPPGAAEPRGSNPVAAAQEPKPEAPEPEKRDFGKELLSAVGTPTQCLHPRVGPDAPASIQIELEAHLIDTGMVTRAYARSSVLDSEELECVRKRVAALRLRGPIEEAPRSVSATLEFKLKTAAKTGT